MTHEAAEIAKLVERVEVATGADLQLDERIHCAVNTLPWSAFYPEWREAMGDVPRYTASLDAAMSLVPADHFVELASHEEGWEAVIGSVVNRANATTPTLAITIAALRARAILSEKGEQK